MANIIRWNNYNSGGTITEIWRSTTPITDESPGEKITEVPQGVLVYRDNFPVIGSTYHYRLTFVRDGIRVNGRSFPITSRVDFGPGGKEILKGSSVLGFMGFVNRDEIGYDFSESSTTAQGWIAKLMYNNRVIYTPGVAPLRTAQVIQSVGAFNGGVKSFGQQPSHENHGSLREINDVPYYARLSKMFDSENLDTDLSHYGTTKNSLNKIGVSETMDLMRVCLAFTGPMSDSPITPFTVCRTPTSISSTNTFITSDYMTAAGDSLVGITSTQGWDSLGPGYVTPTSVNKSSCVGIPILQYEGY